MSTDNSKALLNAAAQMDQDITDRDRRIAELEAELAPFRAAAQVPIQCQVLIPKSPQERLVDVYRELLDIGADISALYDAGLVGAHGVIHVAADTLAPVIAPILASGKAAS